MQNRFQKKEYNAKFREKFFFLFLAKMLCRHNTEENIIVGNICIHFAQMGQGYKNNVVMLFSLKSLFCTLFMCININSCLAFSIFNEKNFFPHLYFRVHGLAGYYKLVVLLTRLIAIHKTFAYTVLVLSISIRFNLFVQNDLI